MRQQYAPTGAAARAGLRQAVAALSITADRLPEIDTLKRWYEERAQMASQEVAVPGGEAGLEFSQRFFRELESHVNMGRSRTIVSMSLQLAIP